MHTPESHAAPLEVSLALRTTQMLVLADITTAIERYERLGLSRISTGDDGCVGMLAGETGVILATAEFMTGDFGAEATEAILGRAINYLRVTSVDVAKANLSPDAVVFKDAITRIGTRELLVDNQGEPLILAETL
jgi:hypothetical protein